jgi:hypothetical protein
MPSVTDTLPPLDTQQLELIGRTLLVGELLRDGLEVALPERDRGIDLIAYVEGDQTGVPFVARPIQMKARTAPAFSVASKYERVPSLLLAYLWNVDRPRDLEAFFMTYAEAFAIAQAMGWTTTPSWKAGLYRMSPPSAKLRGLLEPHRMAPGRWRAKVLKPVRLARS